MDWQQRAMRKPRGNCSRADEHAGICREQSSKDRGAKNQNASRHHAGDCRDPHGNSGEIDMIKDRCAQCDYRRHSSDSTEEKIKWNFPRPDRGLYHRLSVVTRLFRNRTARNIDTTARNNALLPRLLAPFLQSLFGWRVRCHEKNAKASSVTRIDTTAVANAAVHADFK